MTISLCGFFASLLLCQAPQPPGKKLKDTSLGEIAATAIPLSIRNIYSVALSPDGKSVVCSSLDGTTVHSFPEGKLLQTLAKNDERPAIIAFSADSKRLIGAAPGLRVWDLETGKLLISEKWDWDRKVGDLLKVYSQWKVGIISIPAVSHDRKRLYIGGSTDDFHVIDIETGKELKRIRSLGQPTNMFAPSPDGKTVAVTTSESMILFRTDTWAELSRTDLPNKDEVEKGQYYIQFAPDNEQLFLIGPAAMGFRSEISIWNCRKGDFAHRFPSNWPHRTFTPFESTVAVIGDGRYALIWPNNNQKPFEIFDLKEGKSLGFSWTAKGGAGPLILTPDKKCLVGGVMSNNIVIIKVEDVLKLVSKDDPPKKP